ncbi:MAG: hypothetical protein MZU91_06590 [Desulfosudis oleivorans]|nr:hypothetical protein [Desulfosudis oleivorans]
MTMVVVNLWLASARPQKTRFKETLAMPKRSMMALLAHFGCADAMPKSLRKRLVEQVIF